MDSQLNSMDMEFTNTQDKYTQGSVISVKFQESRGMLKHCPSPQANCFLHHHSANGLLQILEGTHSTQDISMAYKGNMTGDMLVLS